MDLPVSAMPCSQNMQSPSGLSVPFIYLLEKGDSCAGVAFVVVLAGETVRGGAFGGLQLSENHFLVDVEQPGPETPCATPLRGHGAF